MPLWGFGVLLTDGSPVREGLTMVDRMLFIGLGVVFALAAASGTPLSPPHPGSNGQLPKRTSLVLSLLLATACLLIGIFAGD